MKRLISCLYILLIECIGLYYFTKGFLLSRPVLDQYSTQADIVQSSKAFDKAVVIIIDALRFDFTIPIAGSAEKYANQLPFMYNLFKSSPENAVLLKFIADPPTTTLQRLKGLTTGSLPTFVDAGANFAGYEIEEDNWLHQAKNANKSIGFVGDDTWTALFNVFDESYPYESLNVWDLYTVDNGVKEHIFDLISKHDIAIGHMLGVDHAGHRYGPSHPVMSEKLQEMDHFVEKLVSAIDEDTILFVMGDHGMDPKGDHGGDSTLELEAALFMYAKRPFFTKLEPENVYSIAAEGRHYREVAQIDLVSTISLLLGIPIPFNNLGFPIREALGHDELKSALAASNQVHRYMHALYPDDTLTFPDEDYQEALSFQSEALKHCRDLWVNFDIPRIFGGITICVMGLVSALAYINELAVLDNYPRFNFKVIVSGVAGSLLGCLPTLRQHEMQPLAGCAIGMVTAFLLLRVNKFSFKVPAPVECFSIGVPIAYTVLLMSNSFTVWEDRILQHIMLLTGVLMACSSFRLKTTAEQVISLSQSVIFLALTKISSMSVLCREEQGQMCETTFYQQGTSMAPGWSYVVLSFLCYVLPKVVISYYRFTESFHGAAVLWLKWALPSAMIATSLYWWLEGFESHGWGNVSFSQDSLDVAKHALAQAVLIVTLIVANYFWYRGAMCLKVDMREKKAIILGFGNSYGSYYLILLINVFAACLIVSKPVGGAVLSLLLIQILSLMEFIEVHDLYDSMFGPVVLGMMGSLYFFSTGHYASLQAIQWDTAFIPFKSIIFPFTHVVVGLNTFAPYILTTMAAPLLVFWKLPPTDSIALQKMTTRLCLTIVIYHAFVCVMTMLAATILRRHLMIWKIFAPRFMLGGVTLIAVGVAALVAVAASTRVANVANLISSRINNGN